MNGVRVAQVNGKGARDKKGTLYQRSKPKLKLHQNGLTPIPHIDISHSRKSAIHELILSLYTPALLIELEWLSPLS